MMLLDVGPVFENRITLGQVVTTISIIGGFAFTIVRRYLRSEEDADKVKDHEKLLVEIQSTQSKLTGTQTQQQQLLEQQAKRLDRVEDHLFFKPRRQKETD